MADWTPDPAAVEAHHKAVMKWAKKKRMTVMEALAIRELGYSTKPEKMSDMALAMVLRAESICDREADRHGYDLPIVGVSGHRGCDRMRLACLIRGHWWFHHYTMTGHYSECFRCRARAKHVRVPMVDRILHEAHVRLMGTLLEDD